MTEEKDSLNNKSKNKGTKDLSCFIPEGRSLGDLPTELVEEQASIVFDDGHVIGKRFEVIEMLGFGGMGSVYKVKDLLMHGQIKALKTILPSLVTSSEARDRFISEAQIVQSLRYEDGIVVVYDIGKDEKEDILFLTMELLEGCNLADYIKENNGKIEISRACAIVSQICRALDYAHHRKVIHRDIKPHNIFILPDGRVKLLDFGLAKLISSGVLARSNIGLGTAYYMSPEQSMGEEVDERSDIFALGAVFYQMLSGIVPMGRFKLPGELNKDIPESVDAIVERCLNQQPEDRYDNVKLLEGDLDKLVFVEKERIEGERRKKEELKRQEVEEKKQVDAEKRIHREAEERKRREEKGLREREEGRRRAGKLRKEDEVGSKKQRKQVTVKLDSLCQKSRMTFFSVLSFGIVLLIYGFAALYTILSNDFIDKKGLHSNLSPFGIYFSFTTAIVAFYYGIILAKNCVSRR